MKFEEAQARRAELLPELERLLRAVAWWRRHNKLTVVYSRMYEPPGEPARPLGNGSGAP